MNTEFKKSDDFLRGMSFIENALEEDIFTFGLEGAKDRVRDTYIKILNSIKENGNKSTEFVNGALVVLKEFMERHKVQI